MGSHFSCLWRLRGTAALALSALGLQSAMAGGPPGSDAAVQSPLQRIFAHGPWPVRGPHDPSNRVAGQAAAVEFGYRMFREPRLSVNGYVSCVTCHQADRAFTDGIARAHALAPLQRNTPALANLGVQQWYGWDGASDSLWMASLRPMLDAREFGSDAARIANVVRIGDGLACRYQNSFAARPARHDAELVMVNVAKAIAAFVATLTTGRTAFDDYRDALLRGDGVAADRYPPAAQRGLRLFVGTGGCATCHGGPNFSDGRFHPARAGPADAADSGRARGISLWKASVYNRLGRFNDDPLRKVTVPEAIGPQPATFRTPSLRNVAVTPPYMHDGSVDALREAAAHAAAHLTVAQMDDIVVFLHSLTDVQGARQNFPPVVPSACK